MASYYRTDEPTPAGGDYSEIYYLDDQHNVVDEEEATRCIICECKKDGTLVNETFGFCKNSNQRGS